MMGALAIFAAQILLLTYSTSFRHCGQAKAGSDAPLAQPHRGLKLNNDCCDECIITRL
jgi:hypothetical protein